MTSSPSKAPYGRTYDSKLVTREMHRLGSNAPPSVPSLPNPATIAPTSTSSNDPWGALHVNLLPLFNREPLRVPIEELNNLVKRHISAVISQSPPRALTTLENDTVELLSSGMVTLNARLAGTDDDKLIPRVVELWGFFWDQVLPYVEGSLLPMQTDGLLQSLYRPKRPSSPTRSNAKSTTSQKSVSQIDVRTIALRCFRDKIIVPLSGRLSVRLSSAIKQDDWDVPSRLEQMLLVLTSQSRQRLPTLTLTPLSSQLSPAESAVADLLLVLRLPRSLVSGRNGLKARSGPGTGPRAPSFLSNNTPRDRRGRIAQRRHAKGLAIVGFPTGDPDDGSGDETPRNATSGFADVDRDKGREFLEVLRNAEADAAGNTDSTKNEEAEDEPLGWDEAQAVVERMVGMTSQETSTASRRRMT
ncbi:hypothetical protein VKT23_001005 [Stygiomarasmius scandens]|uniref:HbrB-domain-containing protein n=1 Tax=Marasmiellus scandens TaxID=2682957 RepID=A0ABR1K641_9AGAR